MSEPITKIDIDKIVEGINPAGIDPEMETKARKYAAQDYELTVGPVFKKVLGDLYTDELETKVQLVLIDHKIEVLTNSKNKIENIKKSGKPFKSIL